MQSPAVGASSARGGGENGPGESRRPARRIMRRPCGKPRSFDLASGGNGTCEFHSEALDGAPTHAGTFTASKGNYKLHAINLSWDVTGTYTFQGPDTMIGREAGNWNMAPHGPEAVGIESFVDALVGPRSVRCQPQFGNSLNPRPLRIIGTHFSARAALVFACLAEETWKMYDFLRPGVSVANADLRTSLSSSLLCNSSGIGYSEDFFRSIFAPDFSNSIVS